LGELNMTNKPKQTKGCATLWHLPFTNEKYLNAKEELKGNSTNFTMQNI